MYYEIPLKSKKVFRMEIQKRPYQKLFKLGVGIQNYNDEFTTANRKFDLLEILIVLDKSYKYITIYDSYYLELTRTTIQSLEIENMTNTYSITNYLKFDVRNNSEKYMVYMRYVAWTCNGCSITSLTDYANNQIFQELSNKKGYFTTADKKS